MLCVKYIYKIKHSRSIAVSTLKMLMVVFSFVFIGSTVAMNLNNEDQFKEAYENLGKRGNLLVEQSKEIKEEREKLDKAKENMLINKFLALHEKRKKTFTRSICL